MDRKKLKHLIHERKKTNQIEDSYDSQIPFCQLKVSLDKARKDGTLNIFRIKTLTKLRNNYEYEYSDHIRLKPYFEAEHPVMWQGIVSHITTPNAKTKPVGDILIDKVEFDGGQTGLFQAGRPIDYHLWLSLERIKMVSIPPLDGKHKISIGDVIQGISLVTSYGRGKYGLGTTFITGLGVPARFTAKNEHIPHVELISNYDRGDDWVLEVKNNPTLVEKIGESILTPTINLKEYAELRGHVDVRYQPARYDKYFERLVTDKAPEKNYDLLDADEHYYAGSIVGMKPVWNGQDYELDYKLKNIWLINGHKFGALVSAGQSVRLARNYILPKESPEGSQIKFKALPDQTNKELLSNFSEVEIYNYHASEKMPTDQDALLGYFLLENQRYDFNARPYVMKYLAWLDEEKLEPTRVQTVINFMIHNRQLLAEGQLNNKIALAPSLAYEIGDRKYYDVELVLDLSNVISETELNSKLQVLEQVDQPAPAKPDVETKVEKPKEEETSKVDEESKAENPETKPSEPEASKPSNQEMRSVNDLKSDLGNEQIFIGEKDIIEVADSKGQIQISQANAKEIPLPTYKKLLKYIMRTYVNMKAVMPESDVLKKLRLQGYPVQELHLTGQDLSDIAKQNIPKIGLWFKDGDIWRFSAETFFSLVAYFKDHRNEFAKQVAVAKAKETKVMHLAELAKEEQAEQAEAAVEAVKPETKPSPAPVKKTKPVITVSKKAIMKPAAEAKQVRIITAAGTYLADEWHSLDQAQAELAKLVYRTNPSFIPAHEEFTGKEVLLAPAFVQLIEEV